MSIKEWLKKNTDIFFKNNYPKKEVFFLLSFVIKKNFSWIIAFDEYILNKKQLNKLNNFVKRRLLGEPIDYITKECNFWSIKINICNKSIVPRIDSEIIVEKTLELIKKPLQNILDLGCGCGPLTLALAKEKPNCFFWGVDYINQLIFLAKKNKKKLNLNNVNFIKSNWFNKLYDKYNYFDIIISNPPYIDIYDPHLLKGDLLFEPLTALVADDQGLFNIKFISLKATNFLKKNGWIIFEHGWKQAKLVRNILIKNKFINVFTNKDHNGCNRITGGMKK